MDDFVHACPTCPMRFQSEEVLKTHQAKFCVDSQYAEPQPVYKSATSSTGNPVVAKLLPAEHKRNSKSFSDYSSLNQRSILEQLKQGHVKKELDTRVLYEKQRLAQFLKSQHLRAISAFEQTRKDELAQVNAERQQIKQREQTLCKEIAALEQYVNMEEEYRQRQQAKDQRLDELRGKHQWHPSLASQVQTRAHKVSQLQEQRRLLELERKRVSSDLTLVKQGVVDKLHRGIPSALSKAGVRIEPQSALPHKVPESVQRMQAKWQAGKARLERLKQSQRTEPLYTIPPSSAEPNFTTKLTSIVKDLEKENPELETKNIRFINDYLQQRPMQILQPPTTDLVQPTQARHQSVPVKRPVPLPEPVLDQPIYSEPWPYVDPIPYRRGSASNEKVKLRQKLKKLKRELKAREENKMYSAMQAVIGSLQRRMNMPLDYGDAKDLLPEERVLQNVQRQEQQELHALTTLPKDSDLYKSRLDHFKQMSNMRTRMESMLQEITLQRLKRNFEREMGLEERRVINEQWVEDQKHALIASKLEVPLRPPRPRSSTKTDKPKSAGFYVYWDFLLGTANQFHQYQLTFAVYQNGKVIRSPQMLPPCSSHAVFGLETKLKSLAGVVAVEVQAFSGNGDTVNLGWTLLKLSSSPREVNRGNWKLPLLQPPAVLHCSLHEVSQFDQIPFSFLGVRLSPHPLRAFGGNPAEAETAYQVPEYFRQSAHKKSVASSVHREPSAARPLTPKGLAVSVVKLQGLELQDEFKIRSTLYFGSEISMDENGQYCVWLSPAVPVNARLQNLNIQSQFNLNLFSVLERANWSEPVYMTIEILQGSDSILTPVAWSAMQLTDLQEKTVLKGLVSLRLFQGPCTFPEVSESALFADDVKLDLFITLPEEPKPVPQPEFIRSAQTHFTETVFSLGSGFDFYVDGARHLPQNTGCTKILVRGFTSDLEKVGEIVGGLPLLNPPTTFPEYGFRMEFREEDFDPTTLMVITILTIDPRINEVRVLGHAVINAFLKTLTKEPVTNPNESEFLLNQGCFQLPIYRHTPQGSPMFVHSWPKMERVPAATLLVRITEAVRSAEGLVLSTENVPAPLWVEKGLIVEAPNYQTGAYNTSLVPEEAVEDELSQYTRKENEPTVKETTLAIINKLGRQEPATEDDIMTWIDRVIEFKKDIPVLDL